MVNSSDDRQELMVLDRALQVIAETNSLPVIKDIRDQAEALRKYAKSAAKGLRDQNTAAEIRLRAERKGGSILHDLHLHGGDRRSSTHDEYLNLEKIGISRNQSQRWQTLSKLTTSIFDGYIRECKSSGTEITCAELLRHARRQTTRPTVKTASKNRKTQQIVSVDTGLATLIRQGETFACISVYPPWPKVKGVGQAGRRGNRDKYFAKLLARLPVPNLAAEECHLHLMTTSANLQNALNVMRAWGFTYRNVLVCVKAVQEYGDYWCGAQDFLVLGTKGHRHFRDNGLSSPIDADWRTQTGGDSIRQLVESASLGPYLGLFSSAPRVGRTVISGE